MKKANAELTVVFTEIAARRDEVMAIAANYLKHKNYQQAQRMDDHLGGLVEALDIINRRMQANEA